MTLPSPCIQVCQIDPRTGVCIGCWRTGDEIARWFHASDHEKREILEAVEKRRQAPQGKPD